jgi:predicted MPP superfamily phosphohydrolase
MILHPTTPGLMPVLQFVTGSLLLILVAGLPLLSVVLAYRDRQDARRHGRAPRRRLQIVGFIALIGLLAALIDTLVIEPKMLTTTRVSLTLPAMPAGKHLRLVQLSDLHLLRYNGLHRRIVERIRKEHPDVIVITGDLLTNPQYGGRRGDLLVLFGQLADIAPLVMIPGNHDYSVPFYSSKWTYLECDFTDMTIAGVPVRFFGYRDIDVFRWPKTFHKDPQRVNIMLEHTPEWFGEVAKHGMDLALAGHTHGGQVRLPWWGAIHTNSRYGKRWEYGLYRVDGMPAFITRGIGGVPYYLTPRFCCPPEVVVMDLSSTAK